MTSRGDRYICVAVMIRVVATVMALQGAGPSPSLRAADRPVRLTTGFVVNCPGECPSHPDRLGGVARLAVGIQASASTVQWTFGTTGPNVEPRLL